MEQETGGAEVEESGEPLELSDERGLHRHCSCPSVVRPGSEHLRQTNTATLQLSSPHRYHCKHKTCSPSILTYHTSTYYTTYHPFIHIYYIYIQPSIYTYIYTTYIHPSIHYTLHIHPSILTSIHSYIHPHHTHTACLSQEVSAFVGFSEVGMALPHLVTVVVDGVHGVGGVASWDRLQVQGLQRWNGLGTLLACGRCLVGRW